MLRQPTFGTALLICGALFIAPGCNPAVEKTENVDKVFTSDVAADFALPEAKVLELRKQARIGDLKAANELLQYYSAQENQSEMLYWEDWLAKRGDESALRSQSLTAYIYAERLGDRDPEKLKLLERARKLNPRDREDDIETSYATRLELEWKRVKAVQRQ
ncbi:MAG: hypothetical protein U1E64_01520 [Sphingomonadaceae bacterium]